MSDPYDKDTLLARIQELEELYRAAQEMLNTALINVDKIKAEAWDEGWHTGQLWAFSDLDEHAKSTNPYREAS